MVGIRGAITRSIAMGDLQIPSFFYSIMKIENRRKFAWEDREKKPLSDGTFTFF